MERHGAVKRGYLFDGHARTHADAAGAHPADQAIDDEPPAVAGRLIVPFTHQVWGQRRNAQKTRPPSGTSAVGLGSTTAPSGSGTPRTRAPERTGPIRRPGKLETAMATFPPRSSGPGSPLRRDLDLG